MAKPFIWATGMAFEQKPDEWSFPCIFFCINADLAKDCTIWHELAIYSWLTIIESVHNTFDASRIGPNFQADPD